MKRGVSKKSKKIYIEIGFLIVVIIVAIIISSVFSGEINFEQTESLWEKTQPQQTQTTPQEQDIGLSCNIASVEIIDISISAQTARMLVRNNGGSNNLQMVSAKIFVKDGDSVETTTPLDKDFDRGKVKFLAFDSPKISCETFSSAVLTTNCAQAKATFSGIPDGC